MHKWTQSKERNDDDDEAEAADARRDRRPRRAAGASMKKFPKRKTNRITARDRLAYRIRIEHAAVENGARDALTHARAAGELLIRAKNEFGHGYWMKWVEQACQFSHSTANLYMRIARE